MDLTNSLFQWIRTFELRGSFSSPKDLCDGVAITYALVKIDPDHFSPSLLTKIETECGTSWFLRVSNLRRIYLPIVDFYSEVVERTIPERLQPDLEAIARDHNLTHLGHLLQLVLGCAINCSNKEQHIAVMTTLSFEIQQGLKVAIDELEYLEENPYPNESLNHHASTENNANRTYSSEEFNRLQEELSVAKLSKEMTFQRCHELESIVSKLKEEKNNLKLENERLADKFSSKSISASEAAVSFNSIEHEQHFQRLNNQINALQSDLARMEENKEDYRISLEIKEKELHKTLLQVEQLQSKLNEFKNARDELDRLNYLNEEIIKYKNINEVQRKKLEEFQELKKQVKILEDRNASLIKQNCELEEEKKSVSGLKGQLELLKKQRDELRTKSSEESFRADKAEDELKRVYKKYDDMTQEKERLQIEFEGIKLEMASDIHKRDLQLSDQDLSTGVQQQAGSAIGSSFGLFKSENTGHNEKIIRLEFENEKLKKELNQSNDQKVKLLESQLEDEKTRLAKLESENRANNQRIINLEGQLKEFEGVSSSSASIEEVVKLRAKLKELEKEKSDLRSLVDKKAEELAEKDERFKKHVNKAKETFDLLETHINNSKISSSLPDTSKAQSDDVCYWRELVNQKDVELERLKSDSDKSNAFRDIEERLMTIGFHNLSLKLQRKAAEERIYSNNFSPNPTFMQRQRQASSRKFIIPPSDLIE